MNNNKKSVQATLLISTTPFLICKIGLMVSLSSNTTVGVLINVKMLFWHLHAERVITVQCQIL